MSLKSDAVLSLFKRRYDYYSAPVVLREIARSAGLDPAGAFDAAALSALADAVEAYGDRTETVVAGLRAAAGDAGPAEKAPAKKPEPEPAAEAPAPEAPPAEAPAPEEPAAEELAAPAPEAPATEEAPKPRRKRRTRKKPEPADDEPPAEAPAADEPPAEG